MIVEEPGGDVADGNGLADLKCGEGGVSCGDPNRRNSAQQVRVDRQAGAFAVQESAKYEGQNVSAATSAHSAEHATWIIDGKSGLRFSDQIVGRAKTYWRSIRPSCGPGSGSSDSCIPTPAQICPPRLIRAFHAEMAAYRSTCMDRLDPFH